MFVLDDLSASLYSDLHKDVYGYRPRALSFATGEEFDRELDRLQGRLVEVLAEERERELNALDRYEARIERLMIDHGISRATAVRWDMQAEDTEELDYYLWKQGLESHDLQRLATR